MNLSEYGILSGLLHVGVYVGEVISAQIATAFQKTNTPWNTAMKAIGIVELLIAVLVRFIIREPARQTSSSPREETNRIDSSGPCSVGPSHAAKNNFVTTVNHVLRVRSFWILSLCWLQIALGGFFRLLHARFSLRYISGLGEPSLALRHRCESGWVIPGRGRRPNIIISMAPDRYDASLHDCIWRHGLQHFCRSQGLLQGCCRRR
ncbi:hypothetical protein BJ546DRAFT_600050 [Cryomyces antarcticus]